MFKIQRYSTDYTFGRDGLIKSASAAEDVARKEPSLSNDAGDAADTSGNADSSWMNPKVGDWVTVKGPDPGYRIDTPGEGSVMAPGKAGLRHMKFRVEAIQIEHGESELAWVQQGLKGTNFIAFPLNRDGIYIYKHGGYEWPDNDGDGKKDDSGPLHQRDTLPMTWVEMTDENKPKVHLHNRWMGTTGRDITLSYAYAMATGSEHAGPKPVAPEAPTIQHTDGAPEAKADPTEAAGTDATEAAGTDGAEAPVIVPAPEDKSSSTSMTGEIPVDENGDQSPDWKDGDFDWWKPEWNPGIVLELGAFPFPEPRWPGPKKREWKRRKRVWEWIKKEKAPETAEVTPAETAEATPAETADKTPAFDADTDSNVARNIPSNLRLNQGDGEAADDEGTTPKTTGWEGNVYTLKGEVKVEGPDDDWQKYIDATSRDLRESKTKPHSPEDALTKATEVWKAWMERGAANDADNSYKAFVSWYIAEHEREPAGDKPPAWHGQKESGGKWKGKRGGTGNDARRYMWVTEAPAAIRAEISNEALDGHLDSEAYDVTMDWSNEKRSQIAFELIKLSNHLDSINEFDLSDSLDEVANYILDN